MSASPLRNGERHAPDADRSGTASCPATELALSDPWASNGRVTPAEVLAYVERRGYRARILEVGSCIELLGPRRNRSVVVPDANGGLSIDEVSLWCDGVDYATAAIVRRRAQRRALDNGTGL